MNDNQRAYNCQLPFIGYARINKWLKENPIQYLLIDSEGGGGVEGGLNKLTVAGCIITSLLDD